MHTYIKSAPSTKSNPQTSYLQRAISYYTVADTYLIGATSRIEIGSNTVSYKTDYF